MDEQFFKEIEKQLTKRYPFGIPRRLMGEATGGILNSRHLANLDCLNKGIPDRHKSGRDTIYSVRNTVGFIRDRIRSVESKVTEEVN